MSDVTSSRLLTSEDLLNDPARYERGELWDGRFVVCDPSGGWHGALEMNVGLVWKAEKTLAREGWVFGASQGFVVARDPDRVLSPDVSWMSKTRLPTLPRRGFIEGAPDIAVEVRSPTDSWISVIEKGGVWIGHGARVVWCIDPEQERVWVLRPGEEPASCDSSASATLRPVFDIDIPVARIFEGLA